MRLCLRLAERGRGSTRPNPVVGAIVVRGKRRLAGGFHARPGGDHAEVAALRKLGFSALGATLYVSLEPCCHTGRTGPCTDVIIRSGVARVVIGCRDPNPLVDGGGIRRLRRAGIRVDVGCIERECRDANRPFLRWIADGRPLVTLKAAVTLDGFIAEPDGKSRWITGPAARQVAHEFRATHDAVLVGAGTVLADDPALTVRLPGGRLAGRTPLRVVLDGRLRTPARARVLRKGDGPATLLVAAKGAAPARVRALEQAGAEVAFVPGRRGRIAIRDLLELLARRGVQTLLVEGGAAVHGAFIDARLVDRVALFVSPRFIGRGVPMAAGAGLPLARALSLGPLQVTRIAGDILLRSEVEED